MDTLKMANRNQRSCALVAAVVSFAIAIWGFVDCFRKKQTNESDSQHHSRMIRGVAFVLLSLFVLSVGGSVCWGVMGMIDA